MAYLDNMLTRSERVLLSARRHPIYVVRRTAWLVLGVVVLWVMAGLVWLLLPDVGGVPVDVILGLLLVAGALVPLAMALYRFAYWWKEQYVITNYRIIQVEGLMNRRTFDSALEMVNDVQMNQGLLGRIFNYGTIHILTGSELGVNNIEGVSKPFEFKRALLEAKLAYSRGEAPGDGDGSEFAPANSLSATSGQDTSRIQPVAADSANSERVVVALAELRNAGVISESEYQDKMRKLNSGEPANRPWDSG